MNAEEYKICKVRKHAAGGKDGEWIICKFCGVKYKYITKLVEQK